MIVKGRILEAFEKYFHEQVVMQENETEPRVVKTVNRHHELEYLSKINVLCLAKPLKVTAGQNATMVEWHLDYTHAE